MEEVVDYFGTQDNQHVRIPMARIMQVQDILNDLTVWEQISPIKESEQAIMARYVSRLYEDSLTLFDRGYPGFALMYLMYGLRWGIETSYGKQKNQLQMEQFSWHRVICIQQDYAAGLFVANLQSLIEKQSEDYLSFINRKRIYQYKINRNVSWASMKHSIVKLFLDKNPEQILLQLQKAFERNLEPVRPGRHYLRNKKVKRLNGKYQTLTNYKRAI